MAVKRFNNMSAKFDEEVVESDSESMDDDDDGAAVDDDPYDLHHDAAVDSVITCPLPLCGVISPLKKCERAGVT